MAKFLFTVWPYPGHIHPNVAIAHALARRGHDIGFYTGGSIKESIEAEGFRCFPFDRLSEAAVEEKVLALDSMSLQWWNVRRRKTLLADWLLGTIEAQLDDLDAVNGSWHPDVLVGDPAMWGPLLVLQETARIPLAVMSYVAACMLPGPDGPILGVPLRRAKTPFARFGRRLLRQIGHVVAADVRRSAEEIRQRYGLPPIGTSVTAFAGHMPLYIVPSTPAYDRGRNDLPRSVHYVGPCHWDKPGTNAPAAWLTDLPRDRPVIYVTEGTMHSKAPILLRATLEGLASLRATVIATTGRHRSPSDLALGPIPANARVERWIPHTDLLPRVDAIITTGGTGTVLAGLAAGVPLVVVPMAWDQPENAWRVAEAGAGIRIAARQCTPMAIRDAVDRVIGDSSFRENARRLANDFAKYDGAATAADLLEQLAVSRGNELRLGSATSASSVPRAAERSSHVPHEAAAMARNSAGSSF